MLFSTSSFSVFGNALTTMKHGSVFIYLFLFSIKAFSQEISPLAYWSFDGKTPFNDTRFDLPINLKDYKCPEKFIPGHVGNAIQLNEADCIATTNVLKNVKNEFTLEFLFRGKQFSYISFPEPNLVIKLEYPRFGIRSSIIVRGNKQVSESFVQLAGSGKRSYDYYVDGGWHHLVFTISSSAGRKEIWVDGELLESISFTPGESLSFSSFDGFRSSSELDEVAIYNKALPAKLILQHHKEFVSGRRYSFYASLSVSKSPRKSSSHDMVDPREFAPGYPAYNVGVKDQLTHFPLPRFTLEVPLKRNMSWMDITYLHRTTGKDGKTNSNPEDAVAITEEMARYWNYYIDIPLLRQDELSASKFYESEKSLHGALIQFANEHPEFPVSCVLNQMQVHPIHAGFSRSTPYLTANDLSPEYYLQDSGGNVIIENGRKWLSPIAKADIAEKDGATSRFYLDVLMRYLKKPPALLNENGEYFGHILNERLLKQDPAVWRFFQRKKMSVAEFSGWFQNRLDSIYKKEVLRNLDVKKVKYSLYNLSAINASYWPDYGYRRDLNKWDGHVIYSTPDFYPRWPDNWQWKRGASNGYGAIAEGRLIEMAFGDRFFSPFVAAGWGKEEENIRPAQWLSLLKSMVMLGADFFYVGYFNVTGAEGKWPNGIGPFDPRGYAYQIAMPAYALALRSWVPEFFERGKLLNPSGLKDAANTFRFTGKAENELIIVRKSGKRYLIYGSIQPNSNAKGNVPNEKITEILLDGKKVRFQIRRQGSVYVFDLSGTNQLFYQLDGWHQYEHPYYWSRNIEIEAESVCGTGSFNFRLCTKGIQNVKDFSSAYTYVELGKNGVLKFPSIRIPPGNYRFKLSLASPSKTPTLVYLRLGGRKQEIKVPVGEKEVYGPIFTISNSIKEEDLQLSLLQGTLSLDKFTFQLEN